jgi:fluoride exporter
MEFPVTTALEQLMTPTESVRLLGRSFLFLKDKAGKLNMDVTKVLLVLLGGAVGTGCRYWLSTFVYSVVEKPSFPYANFIINVSGSFIIGILAELFEARVLVSPTMRAALLTGMLGGYTTFSSFSLETFSLLRDGETWLALVNAFGSVLLGLVAVWMGARLAQLF